MEIIRDYNLKMYSHGCRHTGDRGEEREGGQFINLQFINLQFINNIYQAVYSSKVKENTDATTDHAPRRALLTKAY